MTPDPFFFQAEDGIRDGRVTGVQTCALPILPLRAAGCTNTQIGRAAGRLGGRSEERRVGKECRCRWSADQPKKKRRSQAVGVSVVPVGVHIIGYGQVFLSWIAYKTMRPSALS